MLAALIRTVSTVFLLNRKEGHEIKLSRQGYCTLKRNGYVARLKVMIELYEND